MVPEEQPILLKKLGTEPVLMFLAQCATLAVFGLARVLWDNVKSQLGDGWGEEVGTLLGIASFDAATQLAGLAIAWGVCAHGNASLCPP